MNKRCDNLKKHYPELLLMLSILAIISICFSIYLARFFNNQQVEAARIAEETALKKKKKEVPKKTYEETVNDKIEAGDFPNRMKVPLILQTDGLWKDQFYGVEGDEPLQNTLAINGCAIVSLAMVYSYLENEYKTPMDILSWSGNRYFSKETGTAWHIFNDFAAANKYEFEDLGDQLPLVKEQLKQNHPVIVSVKPGYFTDVGHVMVLTGYNEKENTFWLNNPSDTKEKGDTGRAFTEEEIQKESLHYWTMYKKKG